ncbi:MAG TPA: succinate--CoA ligase subunit alpha [Actinomycetota bacterium]|nr:succinate--CoA ligase subunit alpha [Actinomycetota bacterium]
MSIYVDAETRVLVQGLTGQQGRFHGLRNREYGTKVVAGVTPGKSGVEVDGIPVFDSVEEAVEATGANTSLIFVPAPFAADAILEAASSHVSLVVCITEGVPVHDMARVSAYLACRASQVTLIGPNCPGLISPGKCNVGIIPREVAAEGPVGVVSRSGTLTYQVMDELTRSGIGQSTTVGIGGDPIVGTSFTDCLARFEEDPDTTVVVLIGEIGGDEEQKAAAFIEEHMKTPVVAYVAGYTAPVGKRMGHAGAIVGGAGETAEAKAEALRGAGARVARSPTEVSGIVSGLL